MPNQFWHVREGPIPGLRLSTRAWKALQLENITTLDQLRAVADQLERFDRIGPKTAQIIQAELARVTTVAEVRAPERPSPDSEKVSTTRSGRGIVRR
jgi:hypothetical protein